jgi:hypothetical protein
MAGGADGLQPLCLLPHPTTNIPPTGRGFIIAYKREGCDGLGVTGARQSGPETA